MFKRGIKFSLQGPQSIEAIITNIKTHKKGISLDDIPRIKTNSTDNRLIIRCTDADPHICTEQSVTHISNKFYEELILGINGVKSVAQITSVVFIIDKSQHNSPIVNFARDNNFKIIKINGRHYPFAMDKFLIKRFNAQLVINISKLVQLGKSINTGAYVTSHIITVIWPHGIKVVSIPIGITINTLIEALKIENDFNRIIAGSPLQGQAVYSLEYEIDKYINAITFISKNSKLTNQNYHCINCGLCSASCPTRLIPGLLSRYIEYAQYSNALNLNIQDCLECGCCSIVCPAGRAMVQYMKLGKSKTTKPVATKNIESRINE
jgi:Na+-translocating ferredoxin:NAD+ oxidoreductase RnfC subunit